MAAASDLLPPTNEREANATPPAVPGHQLLRRIAKGSYGEIWLARTELGAFRAVKLVRRETFANARPYDREFAGLQRYEPISREHEGLVDVLQVGRDDAAGFFYYVMELADDANAECGTRNAESSGIQHPVSSIAPNTYLPLTLAHVIRERGPLPVSEVVELGLAMAGALEFLHSRRLVHRDIKPSNIIVVGGQPKLADIGLVADLGGAQSFVGTDGYIPPEGPGTAAADLFSLGKVLYEAATGKDRQDFPDLPTRLGEGHDDPALLELNEVLLKACESQPRARYHSAGEMAADLQRLKAGQSLRALRARRRRFRLLATVTAIASGLTLGGLGLYVLVQHYRTQPRVLFRDDFDGPELDTNLWTWSLGDWSRENPAGRRTHVVRQSGGELTVEAAAEHEEGFATSEMCWIDLKPDLRQLGPCRVEIDLSGTARGGFVGVLLSAGSTPTNELDAASVKLAVLEEEFNREDLAWPAARLRVETLPHSQAAIVYPDANNLRNYDVVDLQPLSSWHLRFNCGASTSRGRRSALSELRISQVRVWKLADQGHTVGRVLEDISGWPVADALVIDGADKTLAKTGSNGAFFVTPSSKRDWLRIERPDYAPADIPPEGGKVAGLVIVRLRKPIAAFGDMVEVIGFENLAVSSIGFRGTNLWALTEEQATNARLLRVDTALKSLSASEAQIPIQAHLVSFAEVQGRLIGFDHWPGILLDLTQDPPPPILELVHPKDGVPIRWPKGCAFDGEFLWFVEQDVPNERYAMHALDLERRAIVRSLPSTDSGIQGLAWDGRQFWVSSATGLIYAVDRSVMLRLGTVQAGICREFRGHYTRLAYGQDHLWGLEPAKRRICKIKITD